MKILHFAAVLLAGVLAASLLQCQQPPPPAAARAATPPPAAAAASAPEPQLTKLESVEIENFTLKMQALNREFSDLMVQINAEHPGFFYDPRQGRFIAIPKPPAAAKAPAKEAPKP